MKLINVFKEIGAEIVLLVIYSTMRIIYAPAIWEPVPRYSDWKVCTRPDYQTRDIKRFCILLVQAAAIYGLTWFFPLWKIAAGIGIANIVVLIVTQARKRRKKSTR